MSFWHNRNLTNIHMHAHEITQYQNTIMTRRNLLDLHSLPHVNSLSLPAIVLVYTRTFHLPYCIIRASTFSSIIEKLHILCSFSLLSALMYP